MKEITIITPVFNGIRYIEACLQNVVDQQCPEAEHLVMDGGSTDGTAEKIREWEARYPHIRLISEKDKGQSDAMNKGIGRAEGKVISFLNVDDYYEPGVLNRVVEIFRDLPDPSFVCGNLNIWNADGSLKHFNRPDRLRLPELVSHKFEWPYNPTAYFYHKSLHDRIGLYNVDNHLCMDYEFILKAAREITLQHVDETWGNFCMVEGSKTLESHTHNPDVASKAGRDLRERAKSWLTPEENLELENLIRFHSKEIPNGKPASPGFFKRLIGKLRSMTGS